MAVLTVTKSMFPILSFNYILYNEHFILYESFSAALQTWLYLGDILTLSREALYASAYGSVLEANRSS